MDFSRQPTIREMMKMVVEMVVNDENGKKFTSVVFVVK